MHGVGALFLVTWLCVVGSFKLEGMGNFSTWKGWVSAAYSWKGFPEKLETVSIDISGMLGMWRRLGRCTDALRQTRRELLMKDKRTIKIYFLFSNVLNTSARARDFQIEGKVLLSVVRGRDKQNRGVGWGEGKWSQCNKNFFLCSPLRLSWLLTPPEATLWKGSKKITWKKTFFSVSEQHLFDIEFKFESTV